MKGDEYSLREISFQREQVGLPIVWVVPHSHGRAIFGSPQSVMPQEGGIFTMLVMEEHEFYYINEYIPGGEVMVNFSSILEPASLDQSVIHILPLHPMSKAYSKCIECKQASGRK